jgi:hypothetical protein
MGSRRPGPVELQPRNSFGFVATWRQPACLMGSYLFFYRSLSRESPDWRLIVGSVVLVLGILFVAKDKPKSEAVAPDPSARTSSTGP